MGEKSRENFNTQLAKWASQAKSGGKKLIKKYVDGKSLQIMVKKETMVMKGKGRNLSINGQRENVIPQPEESMSFVCVLWTDCRKGSKKGSKWTVGFDDQARMKVDDWVVTRKEKKEPCR